jgi:hypothetical protein
MANDNSNNNNTTETTSTPATPVTPVRQVKSFNKSITGKFVSADSASESMDVALSAPMLGIISEGLKGAITVVSMAGVAILGLVAWGIQASKSQPE